MNAELAEAITLLGLGGEETLDEDALRHAYTKFAQEWHPDIAMRRGVGEEEANRRMAEGNKAFSLLKQVVVDGGGSYRVSVTDDATTASPYERNKSDEEPWTPDQTEHPTESVGKETRTAYKSEVREMIEDIFTPFHDHPFRIASIPMRALLFINLLIEALFVYLLIQSLIHHPIGTLLLSPIILFMAWGYRQVAHLIIGIAETSDLLALAFDVLVVSFIVWRYGAVIEGIITSFA